MSAWRGWDRARPKIAAIPATMKTNLRPVMEQGAREITAMQRSLVPVERPPGAHTKGTAKELAHAAGTEKSAIGWSWRGFKIVITAVAHNIPNLGLWIERGTRPGVRGETYRATGYRTGKQGRRVKRAYARKINRTHPGTQARPFFLPAWHALLPGIRNRIAAVWSATINDSVK